MIFELKLYFLFFQPSEEEEIVDLMLVKLGSLFGIKCKKQAGYGQTEDYASSASNNKLVTISS